MLECVRMSHGRMRQSRRTDGKHIATGSEKYGTNLIGWEVGPLRVNNVARRENVASQIERG